VDTALGTRAAKGTLELYLAELGLCFADIGAVLLTHHHPDHYGLAGFLEGLGARVFLHEEELPKGHRFWREPEAFAEASLRLFLDHGMPEEALLGIQETMAKTRERVHPPQSPTPLKDGEVLEVAGRRLKVVWTPGHADGHVAFFLEEEGVLLAGDALPGAGLPQRGPMGLHPGKPLEGLSGLPGPPGGASRQGSPRRALRPHSGRPGQGLGAQGPPRRAPRGPPRPPGGAQDRLGALPQAFSPRNWTPPAAASPSPRPWPTWSTCAWRGFSSGKAPPTATSGPNAPCPQGPLGDKL
jgi:hypothetical protein